jgi:hypothetical protein
VRGGETNGEDVSQNKFKALELFGNVCNLKMKRVVKNMQILKIGV